MAHVFDYGSDGTVHELDEDPQDAAVVVVGVDHFKADVLFLRRGAHTHQSDLVKHQLSVIFVTWCAEFECELLFVLFPQDTEDLSEASDSKLVLAIDIVER